jgi:hypothetical protein
VHFSDSGSGCPSEPIPAALEEATGRIRSSESASALAQESRPDASRAPFAPDLTYSCGILEAIEVMHNQPDVGTLLSAVADYGTTIIPTDGIAIFKRTASGWRPAFARAVYDESDVIGVELAVELLTAESWHHKGNLPDWPRRAVGGARGAHMRTRLRLSLPPATETHAVPLACGSRSRHPSACVATALIDRHSRWVWHARAQAHDALRSRKCRCLYSGAESGVRMTLKIDILQCSVSVAALRDTGCCVGAAHLGRLGSPFRMTLPAVRSSAGDWGMSRRGSQV